MKEIERAIKLMQKHIESNTQSIRNNFEYTPKNDLLQQNKIYDTIIQTLQSELDRQENEALTEAAVRELVKNKEPVFYKPIDKVWEECDIEAKWFIADECMLIAEWLQVGNFYKHKPNGGD